MRKVLLAGHSALLCALLTTAPVAARELATSIDLDYSYSQEDIGGDVKAATSYNQKYEIRYETSLTSAYDFMGAVRVELQDTWNSKEADTSRVAPSLEMQAKGAQAAVKVTYDGAIGTTEAFHEKGEVTTYSNGLAADLELVPVVWPELKLKFQRRRDYQPWSTDTTIDTVEFSSRKDLFGVRLAFSFRLEDAEKIIPLRVDTRSTEWSGKATYKELFWGGTEFELAYEIKETFNKELTQGVFSGQDEDYVQNLRSRLKNSLEITPKVTVDLEWERQFDQDLLELTYDTKLKDKYQISLRWDLLEWFKVNGAARRETDKTAALAGEDDEQAVTDTVTAGFDFTLIEWLLLAGKAEFKYGDKIPSLTGSSLDQSVDEKYELVARNRIGELWDLTLNATTSLAYLDDWITVRETKLKAELKLKYGDLIVTPSHEAGRTNQWDWGLDDPVIQKTFRETKIKFEYRYRLLDLLAATFSHEYGIKVEDELDEVLDFERTLQLNEVTRLGLVITEIVRGLNLEGEVDRTASDTEGDLDPQLVELSYALKLDWKLDTVNFVSTLKFNDKGAAFDDLGFNTKINWRIEQLELTGEYQYDKIYVEQPDKNEKRKLSLRLTFKF